MWCKTSLRAGLAMLRSERSERIRRVRASLKGRVYLGGDVTRHHLHSTTKTTKGAESPKTPAPTTDSLDLSNYCPSDLILKRIYLRRTATAHSFTVGRPRTTPFAARAELLVIVSVLSCCSACPNQHVNESACSELKFRDKLSLNQAHGGSKLSSQLSHFTHQAYWCIKGYSRKKPEYYFFCFRFPATLARSHTTPEP